MSVTDAELSAPAYALSGAVSRLAPRPSRRALPPPPCCGPPSARLPYRLPSDAGTRIDDVDLAVKVARESLASPTSQPPSPVDRGCYGPQASARARHRSGAETAAREQEHTPAVTRAGDRFQHPTGGVSSLRFGDISITPVVASWHEPRACFRVGRGVGPRYSNATYRIVACSPRSTGEQPPVLGAAASRCEAQISSEPQGWEVEDRTSRARSQGAAALHATAIAGAVSDAVGALCPGITRFGAMHEYSRELSRLRCG